MPWYEPVPGNHLWYEDSGSGTPIVFIHGWCMSSAVWECQREELSHKFRVITPDLPGHGNSGAHSDVFDISSCAAGISGLIKHLELNNVMLAGWSLGALIAIETFPLCKDRLSALILISSTPRFVQSVDFPHGLPQADAVGMAKKVHRSIRRALDGFFTRMLSPHEDDSGNVHKLLREIPVPTTAIALQALDALFGTDMRGCLALIDIPTLIVNGDSDRICLPEASEYMAMMITKSHHVVFSGCGHVPFIVQSKAFNACLMDFREIVHGGIYRQE